MYEDQVWCGTCKVLTSFVFIWGWSVCIPWGQPRLLGQCIQIPSGSQVYMQRNTHTMITPAYQIVDVCEFISRKQLYVIGSEVLLFVSSVISDGPLGRLVLNVSHEGSHCEVQFISLPVSHVVLNCYSTVGIDWLCGLRSKRNTLMSFFFTHKKVCLNEKKHSSLSRPTNPRQVPTSKTKEWWILPLKLIQKVVVFGKIIKCQLLLHTFKG